MRTTIVTLSSLAILSGTLVFGTQTAQAGGYYYRARSLYITPPSYAYLPVIGQPPIVVYEPVVTYPAPVAGYYGPVAAPVTPAPRTYHRAERVCARARCRRIRGPGASGLDGGSRCARSCSRTAGVDSVP